jgi:hypothetical protein
MGKQPSTSPQATSCFFAFAIAFALYRIRQTLRVTPAMEAGLAHHVWTIEELVGC